MMIQALPRYPSAGGDDGGGGSITFVGGKSSSFAGSGSTANVSLTDLTGGIDTHPSTDDVVVVSFAAYATDLNLSVTGYTERCDIYGGDRANLGVYTKVMGVSPDTSLTVSATSDRTMVRILVFRGVNTTTPLDVAAVTKTQLDSGNAVIDAITPVTSGAVVIGTAVAQAGNVLDVSVMSNTSSGYAPFLASKDGRLTSCLGSKAWAGGAVGPFTVGGASGSVTDYVSCALALRPA